MLEKPDKLEIPSDWTFRSPNVARNFDAHVREQLPWYDLATGIVAHIARQYLPEGGSMVDVGASTGNIGRVLADTIEARRIEIRSIDNSSQMSAVFDAPGTLEIRDARHFNFADMAPNLVVAFLALMFIPIEHRQDVIERIKSSLKPGGAFVVFDKMESRGGYLGTVMYRLALAAKREHGASAEEVIAKELSLAGLQRPLMAGELDGFEEVFRFGDFAGWVYEAR